ncbi:beta-galactosidase [Actinomyces vulturis]|uniref:beta-galactosidase n=1 Tax=Actinomyces vulturis TaxID=1857645 RepID=UPI00082CBD1D|nr:beta-galactosidase [Actinomyces vulturis]
MTQKTHTLDLNGRVAYGADYNPEQWDEATIAQDIELMKQAGVTMVTLGVFSWALLEPERGHYDLDWIVNLVDRLWDNGIAVDMASATASPPAWLGRAEPTTLAVNAHGVRMAWGSRQHYCPSSPIMRQAFADMAKALATRLAGHPGVAMWHINNEYGCHTAECFCESCENNFRIWLLERYGNLETINRVWGTAFWSQTLHSVEDIIAPRLTSTFPSPARDLDWKRFSSDSLLACYQAEEDVIRAALADAGRTLPVTTNFMGLFEPVDYVAWAEHCDLITNDCYPDPADPRAPQMIAFTGDLMRGLGKGRPWLLMEQAPSQVQWRLRNAVKRRGEFLLGSLAHMAHGADGIMQFQWRQSVAGAETFHSGMVPHFGPDSDTFKEVVETGAVLSRLSGVLGQPFNAQTAVLVDWDSMWQSSSAIGPDSAGGDVLAPSRSTVARSLTRWHATCFENRLPVDVLPASRMDEREGNAKSGQYESIQHRVVVVPELSYIRPGVINGCTSVLERGGCVVVTPRTGVFTVDGHAVQGGYLTDRPNGDSGSMADLCGVRVMAQVPVLAEPSEPWSDPSLPDAACQPICSELTPTWGSTDIPLSTQGALARAAGESVLMGHSWTEQLEVLSPNDLAFAGGDVEVLASYATGPLAGQPAITHRRVGEGHVIYVGVDLGEQGRSAVMRLAAAYAGVVSTGAQMTVPAGVEVTQRGSYLFVLNYSDSMKEIGGIEGWDAVSDSQVTGHMILAPRSGAVVKLSA